MKGLTPALVEKIVAAEHHQRNQIFPSDIVEKIYRYGAPVGHYIEVHAETDRCMDLARKEIVRIENSGGSFQTGRVFAAGRLTRGKGRFQREWHAPAGGVWLVLVLVNTMLPSYARLLPLAAGVSCCEAACHFGVPARIKWVNDVHVKGRKLAGILTETMSGPVTGEEYVLVGIGMNVNNTGFPGALAGTAAGMKDYLFDDLDLSQVAAVLLAKLAWNFGLLCYQEESELAEATAAHGGRLPLIVQSWASLSDTVGRRVRYGFNVVSSPQYSAEVVGIEDSGALVMKLPDGSLITEAGGEIVYLD